MLVTGRGIPITGPWITLILVGAGAIFGAAHLQPSYWPLAWLGVMLTGLGLSFRVHWSWLMLGLFTGGFAGHWLGHPWYFDAVNRWGGGQWSALKTGAYWFVINLSMVLPERLPLMLALLLPRRRDIPLWLWFPLAWLLGEVLGFHFTALIQNSFLYSQWQVQPLLRLLGHWGWVPTTWLCLWACALTARAVYQRKGRYALALPLVWGLGFLMSPLSEDITPLKGVGAVHMASFSEIPHAAPPDIQLLIWPEVIRLGRPRISEGSIKNLTETPPLKRPGLFHLYGQETRLENGIQNSLLAMAPDGTLIMARAKRLLFPGSERPILGWHLNNRPQYIPGNIPPLMEVKGQKIAPLLCYEEFDRGLALQGKRLGAEFLSVSAVEHSVGTNPEAETQFLGVSVLLAVETGLPVVRSSFKGPAALIAPNGRIIRHSRSGTSGILTLEKHWRYYHHRVNKNQ